MTGAGRPRASLGMYDWPWIADANDALWAGVRDRLRGAGVDAPDTLDRGDPGEAFRDPALIFGQTCGYPYMTRLRGAVTLVATPIYDLPGCEGPAHCSFIIVREDDSRDGLAAFRGARAAINARDSNSGMNLFRASVAPLADGRPFFASVALSGAHVASMAMIRAGETDIAAVDCVTFGLAARHKPELVAGLRILARTPSSPSLPFIVRAEIERAYPGVVRAALRDALADPELAGARGALALSGAGAASDEVYARVLAIEAEARAMGYGTLA
jgi:ABC-type phosphate/phosphonate transport system substrate-binding protein